MFKAAQYLSSTLSGFEILSSSTTAIDPVTFQQQEAPLGAKGNPSCTLKTDFVGVDTNDPIYIKVLYLGNENINLSANVPKTGYSAFGFGKDMTDTDMIAWF